MLPSPAMPTIPNGSLPIGNVVQAGAQIPENGQFGAVLARTEITGAPPLAGIPSGMAAMLPAAAADALLPDDGKDLPEAAEPQSDPGPALALLALLPQPVAPGEPQGEAQPAPNRPAATPLDPARPAAPPGVTVADAAMPGRDLDPAQVKPMPARAVLDAAPLPQIALLREAGHRAAPAPVAATLRLLAEAVADKVGTAPVETGAVSPAPEGTIPVAGLAAALPGASNHAHHGGPATVPGAQDFALLIDRLASARENAQPQAATIALAHAEFGQIELRFASDNSGLSVAMTSTDPDFARAVQAAAPPVSAAGESGSAQGRQPGQPGTGENAAGQQHNQPGPQHGSRLRARGPAEPARSDDRPRHGIFA